VFWVNIKPVAPPQSDKEPKYCEPPRGIISSWQSNVVGGPRKRRAEIIQCLFMFWSFSRTLILNHQAKIALFAKAKKNVQLFLKYKQKSKWCSNFLKQLLFFSLKTSFY
jgi:hypothetical protein